MIRIVALLSCIGLTLSIPSPFNHNVHNEKVIGGHDAPPNKWQWQVSVQYSAQGDGSYNHICGGTIIDAFYVMTAAHCIISMDGRMYRTVVGEHNLFEYDGSEQYSPVEWISVHPGWTGDPSNGNDLAIMRLINPVYENGFIAIANLPYPGQILPHNYTCSITGWGLLDSEGSVPAILQEAEINIVEPSICSSDEWWGNMTMSTMVCAGGDGVTSGCQGDSGGPLSCLFDGVWRIYGVVSFGPAGNCSQVTKPTVFTGVSNFHDWIYSVLQ